MPFAYKSGEEIQKGDKIQYHDEFGEIEFVADPSNLDPAICWYVEKYGGGVMIAGVKSFGSVFLSDPTTNEDLEFIRRA